MDRIKKVLLIRPDKAGDALKTLPALRALVKFGPSVEYHLLASEHNQSLFAFEPGVVLHRLPPRWERMDLDTLKTSLASLGLESDLAIHLPCDLFPETERLLTLIPATQIVSTAWKTTKAPSNVRLISPFPRAGAGTDESRNVALILEKALEIPVVKHLSSFSATPVLSEIDDLEARLVLGNKTGRWIGLCPLAGNAHRTHPLAHWKQFLKKMTAANDAERLFLFGSPADKHTLEGLRSTCADPSRVFIVCASSFRALGAYLSRMDGIVAVDSGPLHLSQALGVPSLGILSGGDSKRWFAHRGTKDRFIQRGWWHRYPSPRQMLRAFSGWHLGLSPS